MIELIGVVFVGEYLQVGVLILVCLMLEVAVVVFVMFDEELQSDLIYCVVLFGSVNVDVLVEFEYLFDCYVGILMGGVVVKVGGCGDVVKIVINLFKGID